MNQFTVENYRSFCEQVSLRMEATSIKGLRESVITKDDNKLLPVAVIYGANSSGKSNVLKAMAEMEHLVMTSSKMNPDESLHYEPFMLDTDSRNKPTSLEVQFLAGQARYRYGFSYDKQHIISEYLFVVPFGKHTEKQICLTSGIFAAIRYGLRKKTSMTQLICIPSWSSLTMTGERFVMTAASRKTISTDAMAQYHS